MKRILSERSIVVILFVLVMIVFSFAQRDTRKLDKLYTGTTPVGKGFFVQAQPSFITTNGE